MVSLLTLFTFFSCTNLFFITLYKLNYYFPSFSRLVHQFLFESMSFTSYTFTSLSYFHKNRTNHGYHIFAESE